MILTREKLEKQSPYFYPDDFDITDMAVVSAAYDELEQMQINTPRDLLTMLYRGNELLAIASEAYNAIYFKTLADTTDADARMQLNILVNDMVMPLEKRNSAILKKYFDHPLRQQLSQENYRQLNANFENQIANSLLQNPGISLEISNLTLEYRQFLGSLEIDCDGDKYPMGLVSHLLCKASPEKREAIWQARKQVCLNHKKQFHLILDRLIKAMHRLAQDAGYQNYYEYALSTSFLGKLSMQQTNEIHKSIRKVVLPAVRDFIKQRKKRLNLKTLRPWDLEAEPEASGLRPFEHTDELVEKATRVLYDIRFEYGILLNKMHNTGFLDLGQRPHKVKGEFHGILPFWNAGTIHLCSTGHHRDMVMLFHEMGHVLQTTALLKTPLSMFYELPVQIREIASQSLVYLSTGGWDVFYPDRKDLKTAFRCLYEYDLIQVLYWSIMNNFELVLHANPDWTPEQREKAMQDIWSQYDWGVDWSGLEDWLGIMWIPEFTIFNFPQYSFFSSLSVFNVWQILRNYRHDPLDTISKFQRFLEKAGELSQEEAFQELGIRNDFSERHMHKMIDFIKDEYKRIKS